MSHKLTLLSVSSLLLIQMLYNSAPALYNIHILHFENIGVFGRDMTRPGGFLNRFLHFPVISTRSKSKQYENPPSIPVF